MRRHPPCQKALDPVLEDEDDADSVYSSEIEGECYHVLYAIPSIESSKVVCHQR